MQFYLESFDLCGQKHLQELDAVPCGSFRKNGLSCFAQLCPVNRRPDRQAVNCLEEIGNGSYLLPADSESTGCPLALVVTTVV